MPGTMPFRVLGSVSRLEAAGETEIHQNDLERIEHVTHPAMTKLLQRLEAKGFIQCVPSARDRRYKKITCTEKSRGIHNLILAQDAEVLSQLCAGFSQEEKETLLRLADKLLDRIDGI